MRGYSLSLNEGNNLILVVFLNQLTSYILLFFISQTTILTPENPDIIVTATNFVLVIQVKS